MNRKRRVEAINAWWERRPEERYWLDVTSREDPDGFLASPQGEGSDASRWTRRLIKHVRGGDVIFHYDAAQGGIVAASVCHGRVENRWLSWSTVAGNNVEEGRMRSWSIGLDPPTLLDAVVPLSEIARIQWSLYPALRALEDEVGDPLYYPFEMGSQRDTRPLPGYVLKLPAILVHGIPGLASAAAQYNRSQGITPLAAIRSSGMDERSPGPIPAVPLGHLTPQR